MLREQAVAGVLLVVVEAGLQRRVVRRPSRYAVWTYPSWILTALDAAGGWGERAISASLL